MHCLWHGSAMPVEFFEVFSWECDMGAMTNDAFYAFYLHDVHRESLQVTTTQHCTETNEVT